MGVTSDGANYEWEYVDNKLSLDKPLTGEVGYFAIYVEGTEQFGSFSIFNNGVDVTNKFVEVDREYLSGSDRIVYGKILYMGFYLNDVSSGTFTALARDYYPPNNQFYDNLFGVEIIPSTYTTGDTFTVSTHSLNKSEITSVPPIHLTEEKIKELEEKAKKEKQEIN
ncbi:hypothetical protein [Aneurinibacillus sp. UBA3580]|uniref:hypothetical protein n=1 Tax=Aneurinibacillus sp. UBA3580 TaxID=1946041 RepID=UPI00257AD4F7|nr:hypothetical protein [Aneurinibacillus sp. UBA3580]